MLLPENEEEPLVEMLFRNGTLTVVGIVLSFSLGFVTNWAGNPIPWTLVDLPTLALLVIGIIFQLMALRGLLRHDSLRRRSFDRATTTFIVGASFTSAGVISAIVIDLIQLLQV
jgi:hypothetical protein